MAKSKAPTGLSIARNGTAYTVTWKIGDKDYKEGQHLFYEYNNGPRTFLRLGANVTSYTLNLGSQISQCGFLIRGNRGAYKNGKTTINPGWSNLSSVFWNAAPPSMPTLEYQREGANVGKFKWTHSHSDTDNAPYYHMEACTCVVTHNGWPSEAEWGGSWVVAENGEQSYTETASGNFIRWFRVRAVGVAGSYGWTNAFHSYGTPLPAIVDEAWAQTFSSTSRINAAWRIGYDDMSPLDKLTVQYAIDVPTDTALTAPASGWSDAIEVVPSGGSDRVVVNVADVVSNDQVMWVRVMTTHDENNNYSNAVVAQTGALVAPTINATPNATTGDVVISITENTSCSVACTAVFFRSETDPSNDRIIAILPNGTTSRTINVPDVVGATTTCFGAYSFVGTYSGTVISEIKMRSSSDIDSDIVAVPPANVTASMGPADGAVRIGWEWSWPGANIAELSWADNDFAWQSTEQPSTYKVEDIYSNTWVIMGLETGKRWYFRVRLINDLEDDEVVGPWSDLVTYDLSGIPDKPVLNLSKTVINEGGTFTAKWAYSSSSETDSQDYAEICEVTFSGNTPIYGNLIAYTEASQSVEIINDWTTGTTHYMSVRVTSTSGTQSEWSDPVCVYVADPITIGVTTNLSNGVLQALPLTATITGAGAAGTTVLNIVRAEAYHLYRPDEKDFDGFEGETICTYNQTGDDQISINIDDLVGNLDDGAKYKLIATVTDTYGQTESETVPFSVNWTHKADVPGVSVTMDKYQRIVKITPIAPTGYAAGDTCDIYRITADQPELIYEGATFGETYVDPYPGFGDMCGHRLVTRTANGDYATATGLAWYDSNYSDGDYLEEDKMIIDVDGEQIELPYDLTLDNKWNKDFKRTSYLGGSVQGDWNKAVTRDLNAGTVLVRGTDLDKQLSMRDLAGYAGIAHVRTPEGSSITADVQITETQEYGTKKISYSMTIKAIDPQNPVGMTLEEWNDAHPIGE